MSQIKVVTNAAEGEKKSTRNITVEEPLVLGMTTVEELVESLGGDLVVAQVKGQLKVAFRAVVRRKLEEVDDNDEALNTDDAIMAEDFSDWKPTLRVTKTAEEKAMEALGNLAPEDRAKVLAEYLNAHEEE